MCTYQMYCTVLPKIFPVIHETLPVSKTIWISIQLPVDGTNDNSKDTRDDQLHKTELTS